MVHIKLKKYKRGSKKPSQFIVLALIIMLALYMGTRRHHPVTPVLPTPSLKVLSAAHGVTLGNFAIRSHLKDKPYTDILKSQFDFVLADNTPNWYFSDGGLRPGPNSYNWKQMDEVMAFAEVNHMPVEAHHYLWGDDKWLPKWLVKGNYNHDQLYDLMKDHILTVGGHYRGRVAKWTVVNEAFTRQQHLYGLHDWWADNTGGQAYIDQAFIWARQADPNSKLILNDFNNETLNSVSDAMYNYIKGALSRGVPIDGIGMQMHMDGVHPPVKDEVISNMKRFAELGVKVYVTEFDVNMNDVKATAVDKNKIQENIYFEMVRACIESKVCSSFAFLGITDAETWYNYLGVPDARPLLFDKNYQPKPAYNGVRSALELN